MGRFGKRGVKRSREEDEDDAADVQQASKKPRIGDVLTAASVADESAEGQVYAAEADESNPMLGVYTPMDE
ncbi:MAG UNVERIFIED_CONTAM: hypothetical protein LVQ98_00115 [Rickettsiaceae bacterium]